MRFVTAYKRLLDLKKAPSIYYISGDNAYQKSKYLELLLHHIGIPKQEVKEFSPPVKMDEVCYLLYGSSIFSSVQIFVIRDIDLVKPLKDLGVLEERLKSTPLPDKHYLVIVESDSRKEPKGSFFDYMRDNTELVICKDFKESQAEISKWITLRMGERGRILSSEIIAELAEVYRNDLETLDAEIEKLSWYPEAITKEILARIVVNTRDTPLYYLYEMISIRNGARSLQRLHEALQTSSIRQVINGVAKFLHQILVTSTLTKSGKSVECISETLGMGSAATVRVQGAASRHNPLHLIVALNKLSEIDAAVREVGDSLPSLQSLLYFLCEKPEKLLVKAGESLRGI